MVDDRLMLASDQDRESAAELLSETCALGRLSREELDERAAAAYSAKTRGELRDLTADLPPPVARAGLPFDIVASRRAAKRRPMPDWPVALGLCAPAGGNLAVAFSPVAAGCRG